MENLSSLISKQVISIEEGGCIGYILNACIDEETLKIYGFLVCDEESEKIEFLDCKDINFVGDFVMIKSSDVLSFGDLIDAKNPIGKVVLTENGESLGRVVDAQIENKKVIKIITNKCEIPSSKIFNFGKDYLFFLQKKKKKREKTVFPKVNDLSGNKVEIQSEKNNNKKIETNQNINNISKPFYCAVPFKSKLSLQNLIGKIATSDIFGQNNELIIHKNAVITEKLLKIARKHNKENILIFNCK